MTRQHFKAIAAVLRSVKPDRGNIYASKTIRTKGQAAYAQWDATVQEFGLRLSQFNPQFNAARFYTACGKES